MAEMARFVLRDSEVLVHTAKLRKINIGHHDVLVYITSERVVIAGMVFKRVLKDIPYTAIDRVEDSMYPLIKMKKDASFDIIEKSGERTTLYNYIYGENIPYLMDLIANRGRLA